MNFFSKKTLASQIFCGTKIIKFNRDSKKPTPRCITGRRWFQWSLSEMMIAELQKTSQNGRRVTRVIPQLVTCLEDQACPAWCWFQPMGRLGNYQNGSMKMPNAMSLTSSVGDRQPDVSQMIQNRLLGHCQSKSAHTLCHGVLLAPTVVSPNTMLSSSFPSNSGVERGFAGWTLF